MSALMHDPTFWTAIAFVIFVVALFKPIKKALLAGLDSRIAQIRSEVEEAQRLREEAQALLASYQRKQREAAQEAENIVKQAKEDAALHRAETEKAMEELLKRQEAMAVEKIAQAEAAAVQEVRDIAVDLAIAATEKILAEKVRGDLSDRLVDRAIGELPQKLQ
jgi:F-type H+-transporting ATPase subunit b